MSDNWEDQLIRIRAISSDLRSIMDELDATFKTAEFRSTKADNEIKAKIKAIVANA